MYLCLDLTKKKALQLLYHTTAYLPHLGRLLSREEIESLFGRNPFLGELVVRGETRGVRRQGRLFARSLLLLERVDPLAFLVEVVHQVHLFSDGALTAAAHYSYKIFAVDSRVCLRLALSTSLTLSCGIALYQARILRSRELQER